MNPNCIFPKMNTFQERLLFEFDIVVVPRQSLVNLILVSILFTFPRKLLSLWKTHTVHLSPLALVSLSINGL